MATYIDKDIAKELKTKNWYSWSEEGADADIYISDKLSSLIFDAGTTVEDKSLTLEAGAEDATLKAIFTGYSFTGAEVGVLNYATSLSINSVDVGTVYGGAFIASKEGGTTAAAKFAGTQVTVKGDASISVASATISTVYGGGAGYGSILDGDVNLTFSGTNRVGTVYGGGQKGAVVTGDVNIVVDRTDAQGGRIGTIYGGGDNAVVKGDVNITVTGVNAVDVGTISGSGKGAKARVEGERTLTIADYSGKFGATIKNFDTIVFAGSSAVTLTQSQNATIKSATYEFLIDGSAFGQSSDAMLTWNKAVDTGKFVVTVDVDDDYVSNGFEGKKIYYSSYLTAASASNISVRALNDDGTYSDIDSSAYTLTFVADTDSKGKAKAKGGYVVLSYNGSYVSIDADSDDVRLTSAADRVTVKSASDREIITANVDTGAGNDRVTVQSGAVNKGEIALGTGTNVVTVQADAEQVGSILVSENSKNTINVNGAITAVEFIGEDGSNTYNTININRANAIGSYEYTQQGVATGSFDYDTDSTGSSYSVTGGSSSATGAGASGTFVATDAEVRGNFIDQALNLGAANDTVVLNWEIANNINFGTGSDMLVMNEAYTGTVTMDDGNDVIVVNTDDAKAVGKQLRMQGTDNVLVVANGVNADFDGSAIGDFLKEDGTFAGGFFLGQNATLTADDGIWVADYQGKLDLTDAKKDLYVFASQDGFDAISKWYTKGNGVNATIKADDQKVVIAEDAVVNGKIYGNCEVGTDPQTGAKQITGTKVVFNGTAGGDLEFDDVAIEVAEGVQAKVSSISGLDVDADTSLGEKDYLEADLDRITLGNDATVVATADNLTVAGNVTGDVTYDTKNVAFIDAVKSTAKVTLIDQNVYFSETYNAPTDAAEFIFKGSQDKLEIKGAVTFDNKKLTIADGTEVTAEVLEGGHLTIEGIANGEESKIKSADVTLADNAMFTVGDTTETANWTKSFTGAETAGKVAFRDGSQLVKGIALATTAEITLSGSETARAFVKNDDAADAITLSTTADKLTLAKADVYGAINAANTTADADEITLTDVTVKGIQTGAEPGAAIKLDGADTLVANNATIVGDLEGGIVTLNSSTVDGAVNGNVLVLASTIGEVNGGSTIVTGTDEDGNVVDGITTIKKFTSGLVSITDDAVAQIEGTFGADEEGNNTGLSVRDAQLKGDVAVKAVAKNTGSTVVAADATLGAITQQAGSSLVELLNAAAETGAITQGFDATLGINATAAGVRAGITLENNYANYDDGGAQIDEDAADFPIVNQAMTVEAISRKTGDITEMSAQNNVNANVEIAANGLYQGVTDVATGTKVTDFENDTTDDADLANGQLHKPAVINVGTVNAEFGAIAQTGNENSVVAGFDYDSEGEADVTVGKSTMTMGAITQYSDYVNPDTPLEGEANVVDLSISVVSGEDSPEGQQSTLTLDDIALTVNGKISQTAFANDNYLNLSTYRYNELEEVTAAEGKTMGVINDEGKTQTITVNAEKDEAGNYGTAIEMFAWNGNNEINLDGNVTVNGDIKVGGVVKFDEDGNQYTEDASFGDRVAVYNKLTADAGTVTVNGNVSLIGLNNYLNITNSTDETDVKFANEVYVAGNNNKLTVGTGVTTSNIHFYNLKDYDKFGLDGYEIGLDTYTNLLEVNGTVSEVIVDNENSDDTIIVTGGTVTGDVVTKNGTDYVWVGGYSDESSTYHAPQGDSLIGGNVTMGVKDAASGKNVLYVEGYDDKEADDPVLYTAKIGGNVSLYSNETNELTVGSVGTVGTLDSEGKVVNEVILEASVKPEEYDDEKAEINTLRLNSDAVVNAKVTLTGDAMNTVDLSNTATVAGKLTMSGAYNVVTSNSNSQATLADIEQTATAMTAPGEYNNGIVTDEGLIVKGGIVQEAYVADVIEDETVTEVKYGAVNDISLNDGAHSIAHPERQTVEVDGAIKQTSDGNNSLLIKGAFEGSAITNIATNPPEYSEYNKDTFTEGSFLATIADVTQTSTNDATNGIVNDIELTNTNAGALVQVAAGKAVNKVTVNDADTIELYAYDETGFKFDGDKTTYKKTEIASVTQTGFNNKVVVGYENKVGSVTVNATSIATELKQGDEGYQANYKIIKNEVSTENAITFGDQTPTSEALKGAEVGDITFNSTAVYNTKQVLVGTEEEKAKIEKTGAVAAGATINLTDTTAANITTGDGADTLTLKGKSVVTGTIDLGDFTSEVVGDQFDNTDTLNTTKDVDLSAATIKDVEQINITDATDLLKVSAINTGDVNINFGGADTDKTLDVDTLSVGTLTVTSGSTASLAVGDSTQETAVNFAFNKGIGTALNLLGSTKATSDALTLSDDVTANFIAQDFNTVTFATGANADGATMTWIDNNADATKSLLAFNITDLSTSKSDVGDSFYVGTMIGYEADELTFNGYTWHANVTANGTKGCYCSSSIADTETVLTKDTTFYRYDGANVTLAAQA